MMRRFGLYILAIGVGGLLLALYSDGTAGNRDALREVGGAIVSGAVLAGLVVWFEDRREEQREEVAEQREDAAAQRAWRREIDIRLVAVVRTDLTAARASWLSDLEHHTVERSHFDIIVPLESRLNGRRFADIISEVDALLSFLRDADLAAVWKRWDKASTHHEDVPPPAPTPPQAPAPPSSNDILSGIADRFDQPAIPPDRDPGVHTRTALLEKEAWTSFTTELDTYVNRTYPTS